MKNVNFFFSFYMYFILFYCVILPGMISSCSSLAVINFIVFTSWMNRLASFLICFLVSFYPNYINLTVVHQWLYPKWPHWVWICANILSILRIVIYTRPKIFCGYSLRTNCDCYQYFNWNVFDITVVRTRLQRADLNMM